MATGTIRSERLTSAYYVSLGIFLLAAVTMANPRAAAGRIADALLASLSPETTTSSTSVFAPHAPSSLTVTFRQGDASGYSGAVDTYIDAGFPTTSNATNVVLTTDGVPPATDERQTLVRFDNIFGNGAGQVPVGSTILSATLTFNVSNGTAQVVTFNRMAQSWNAGDAWNAYGVSPWNATAGIQADGVEALAAADASPATIATGTQAITVTSGVQAWSNNPSSNFGWVLRTAPADSLAVDSSEAATLASRPMLTVTYDPPSAGPCVTNADCNDGNPCTTDTCDLGTSTCSHVTLSCAWGSCNPTHGQCEVTLTFQNGAAGYSGTVDTYLDEANPALNHGNDASFFMDNDPTDKQGLLRFDGIFGANGSSQIPPGSTIRSAVLTVNVNDASDTGAAFHRMLSCWDDTNTWTTFGAGIQADGIEAVTTPDVPSTFNNGAPPVLHAITVTNSLAAWSAGAVNLGWAALPLGGSGWGLDSAQGTVKPLLSVTFTPPAACSTNANCDDGNGCTNDTCNVSTGFCSHSVNLGGACTDGVSCTNDTCSACGRCTSADACTLPNVCNTGTGVCEASPVPPSQPTSPSPANGGTASTSPQICATVSDPNGGNLSVTFKGREGGGGSGIPFTVIAMPDTQFYSASFPSTYNAQTTWVRDNRIARNIVMSVGLGDCVDVGNAQAQWTNADAANDILENPLTTGLPDGIPYGIAVGNHDQDPINFARSGADENVTTTLYNQTFPKSRFQGRAYFGGQFPLPGFADSMDNHYELFSAGGMDFIVFHLEWDDGNCSWPSNGSVPTGTLNTCQNVMVWMRDVLLNQYPTRRAIIASHFVGTPGGGSGAASLPLSNQGQAYVNMAKAIPNVFLILGGHLDQANHRVDLANDGHPIYTVVSDYQSRPNGGNGWLRIMTFDPAADTIHIETYSPTVEGGRFINKPTAHADNQPNEPNGNELTLPYDMDAGAPFQTIGTNTNVPSGTQTCVSWPGLTSNQLHEWYVQVNDGTSTVTGPIWSFTTSSCTTNAECADADPCTTDVCNASTCEHTAIPSCCTTAAQCNDANVCTTDSCNGSNTCDHVPNTVSCSDGNACTTGDTCGGGVCVGGAAPNCNDGNACTTDSCAPASGCAHAYAPTPGCCTTGADCNDGNAATTDLCALPAGNCSNPANVSCTTSAQCDDGDACTTDVCNGPNVSALSFDGTNDYVAMGAAPGLNASPNFTVETWFNWTGGGSAVNTGTGGINAVIPLVTKGGPESDTPANLNANYVLGIMSGGAAAGRLVADFEDSATGLNHPVCTAVLGGQPAISTNVWHHAAATYDGTCWKLYLDGVALTLDTTCSACAGGACTVCPGPGVSPEPNSIQHFALGSSLNSSGAPAANPAAAYFQGLLDEIRVWNVARTAAEIQGSMNQQLGAGTGLLGRWGLNENTGTSAADATAPAENGTLTNGPSWSPTNKPSIGDGTCAHTPVAGCCNTSAQCDDGNPCTADTCGGNLCQHAPIAGCCLVAADCNDGNLCTDDSCNTGSNTCEHANNAAPCNDGNICTTSDTCGGGSCQPGTAVPNCCQADAACNDGNTCTTDSCNTTNDGALSIPTANIANRVNFAAGTGSNAAPDYINFFGNSSFTIEGWINTAGGAAASTGVFRHGRQGDFAQVVVQLGGTSNLQLIGSVESNATGADQVDVTSPTVLVANTWNHFALVVDRSGAQALRIIVNGGAPTSAAGALWSTSAISSTDQTMLGVARDATGALTLPFAGRLDEIRIWNYARTQAETAADMSREIESAPGLVHRWSLNAASGTTAVDSIGGITGTLAGAAVFSNTTLPFAGNDTCVHANLANGTTCSDGDACTTTDVCTAGVCGGTAINCDDGNSCTTDSCSGGACSHTPLGDGASCTDGNACTTGDVCASGTCAGTAINCDDGNACTTDSCSGGTCSHNNVANGTTCNDGNLCTSTDVCTAGVCAGTPLNCDDGNSCTTDSCNAGVCGHVNAANGTSCSDGTACTTGDVCTSGTCVGTTLNCDDSNVCTNDACNPATGCVYTNNNATCATDGNPCTDDVCAAGSCTHPVDNTNACTDGNACTGDACVGGSCQSWYAPSAGCCASSANCNDGNAGTTDTCVGPPSGSCTNVVSGGCSTNAQCNDANGCTTDTCVGAVGGSALNFDGTDDNVAMGTALGLNTPTFTLETWIKKDGASWGSALAATGGGGLQNVVALITKGRSEADATNQDCNYFLGITAGGRLVADFEQFTAGPGAWLAGLNHPICATAASAITDNNWHHVAVTYDKTAGKGWRLYLDGAEVTAANGLPATCGAESACTDATACVQNPGVDPRSDSIQRFGLGVAMDSTVAENRFGFFGGEMDEARVWNRVLTQAEIQAGMNQEITSGTGLLGRWGLNENTGTTAGDSASSPTAENGTLRNGGTTANGPAWTSDSPFPAVPGSCQYATVPGCTSCTQDYQCGDSNPCTADFCNTTNDAAISFPSRANTDHMDFAAGGGSNASPDYINWFGTSSFTIEGWVYTDGTSATNSSIFRVGRSGDFPLIGWQLTGTSPSNLQLSVSIEASAVGNDQVDLPVPTALVANTWTHVAVVVDRSTNQMRVHVNGGTPVTASASIWGTSPIGSADTSLLGVARAADGTLNLPFIGRVDELRIWNFARTQAQISADMSRELASGTGLVHRWSFNAGTGTTALDSIGSVSGTLTGTTTWSTSPLPFAGADACGHTTLANGTTCSDDNACTVGDSCQAGSCTSGSAAPSGTACGSSVDSACDNPDTCNASGSCVSNTEVNGTACSDGDACTTGDTCSGGVCLAGTPSSCDDGNPCTDDSCSFGAGCVHTPNSNPCSDGSACTTGDVCSGGSCQPGTPTVCSDDGNVCNGPESCNPTSGLCQSGPNAGSGTACGSSSDTACDNPDTCNGSGSCVANQEPNGTTCSDGDGCTQTDTCQSGVCTGANPVTCTASDQCHVAGTCNPATGTCSNPNAPNGTSCTDGDACTQSDSCQAGTCTGANPVTCTASDQCHVAGTCSPTTGVCSNPNAPNGTTCDDGNPSTTTDVCTNGVCTGADLCAGVTCTASDQCHVAGVCNPATGVCSNPSAPNGTSCTDGDACTQSDSCQAGICTGANPVTCTASDQCHVAGTCNPATGTCSNPSAPNGTSCTDGDSCTQSDTCQAGICTGANPVTCTASDQCHVAGTCNPATGTCSNPSAPNGTTCTDGDACTQSDTCQAGTCTGANPVTCTASDQCHVAGTCNPATGTCSNPNAPNGTGCTDGDACTQSDTCQAGTCTGANPVTCTASDQCHVAGTCSPATGVCSNPNAPNGTTCDDGNPSTTTDVCTNGVCAGTDLCAGVTCTASDQCHVAGVCNPATGTCSNPSAPNGTSCNDGNSCSQSDTCQAGICTGANPVICTASDQCHVAGTCNPATGTCSNPSAPNGTSCTDGDACTQSDSCQAGICTGANPVTCTASDQCHVAGTCNPATGSCSNPSAPNGTSCTDGDACTQSDTCQAGTCTGANPVTCTASDQCHVAGTCSPATGICSNPNAPNGTTCNDGNPSTTTDVCTNGVCAGTDLCAGVTCTASDQCHVAGVCNPATGTCSNPAAPNGTSCSDGDACTQSDSCQTGICTGANPVSCTASDQCHVAGTCNPATGTCSNPSAPNGTSCSDGNACTQSDTCQAGACTGANPVTCTASDQCHVAGVCNPGTGTCSNPSAPNGTSCTDGNACTQSDTCQAGACTGTNPIVCNDSNPCTDDACNPANGACAFVANDANACTDGNVCTTDACSAGSCVHATSGSCDVTGSVFYYRDSAGAGSEPSTKPVPNVGIDATQDATADATTGVSGGYAFDGLYGNVTLTTVVKYGAPRASDHNGAITGTDAAQIARRAVNLVTFSANQQVAGDVTGNGAISALDAAQVARFSVLLVDHFDVAVSTGSDWKFLRCDVYPGCGAPVYNFTPISGAESGKNFHAVLYGDVTGNWSPGSSFTSAKAGESELDDRDRLAIAVVPAVVAPEAGVVRRPAGTSAAISIDALTTPLRAGERRQLTISVGGSDGILGLDLLLTYDARTVAIVDVQAAGLASGWGVAHADEGGTHRISTYGISPLHGDGQVLTVTVEGRGSGTKTRPLVLSAVANEGSIPLVVKPRIKAVERPDVQGVER